MKMKVLTILAAMISTSVMADQPAYAPASAIDTSQPTAPRPAARTSSVAELRSVPLVPGPAVVEANRVNVRGRAGLIGEVIGKLNQGDPVTVIEEVTLKNSKANEPSAWAKINLPESIHVWVHSLFLDRETMTVKATRLNLRGGPGENYSVLGTLQKGDAVRELQAKDNWIQIEAPPTAYAFVAAQYLRQDAPAIVEQPIPSEPVTDPVDLTTVAETPVVTPADEIPVDIPASNVVASAESDAIEMMETEGPVVEEPLPPRIVQREGLVRSTLSIQAPTKFELVSPDNFRPINYLFTSSPHLDLRRYKGLHIIVTGEEGLDERWKNTPVITIQSIRVLE
jgi:uncharacterized protein YgiM (DUF1202 family)